MPSEREQRGSPRQAVWLLEDFLAELRVPDVKHTAGPQSDGWASFTIYRHNFPCGADSRCISAGLELRFSKLGKKEPVMYSGLELTWPAALKLARETLGGTDG